MKRALTQRLFIAALLLATVLPAQAQQAGAQSLRDAYRTLQPALVDSPFGRPIHIESREAGDIIEGSVHAVLNVPFANVGRLLAQPQSWCDVMFLHPNTKLCRVRKGAAPVLQMRIGKKFDQPLDEAHELELAYAVAQQKPDYLQVRLNADSGPLGTRDYRIVLEAIPVENGKTFLHLSYAYGYGLMARAAVQTYLGTVANEKVGFTKIANASGDAPQYVKGMRGLIERNTMRYYLAIESFLRTPAALEKRLRSFYAAMERYPRQLHDMPLEDYLNTKRDEDRHQREEASG